MKNLVLLVLICFQGIIYADEDNLFDRFELQQITGNYYGITGAPDNIIIYNDYGGILRSTDKGNTFRSITIDKNYMVMDMFGDKDIYGLLNKNFIVKSEDYGQTWTKKFLGKYNFHRLKLYKNEIYSLAEDKIIVCNSQLEKTKEYDVVISNINGSRLKEYGDQYNFEVFNDKIYYVSDTTEFTEIDLITNKTRKINLKNLGNILTDGVPSNLFLMNNRIYFTLSTDLYALYENKVELIQKENGFFKWTNFNNNIYYLYDIFYQHSNIDSIYFNQVVVGTEPVRINTDVNDRYISNCQFTAVKFLDSKIVVAVGRDKLIYMSLNGGKTWKLISHMDNRVLSQIYKGSNNHLLYVSKNVKFVHTNDNGITWLPSKFYSPYFVEDARFKDLYYQGTTTIFKDNGILFYEFDLPIKGDTNFIISESNGDVTRLKNNNASIGYFGYSGLSDVKYSFFQNNNTLFLTYNSIIIHMPWIFSFLFNFDDNMNMKRLNFFDSSHVVLMDTFDDGNIYGLIVNYKNPIKYKEPNFYNYKGNLSLIKSTDNGETFIKLKDYDLFNYRISFTDLILINFEHSNEEIFFYYRDTTMNHYQIYSINVKTKELMDIGSIAEEEQPTGYGIQKINSKYYYESVHYFPAPQGKFRTKLFENDNPYENPDNWKEITISNRYSHIYVKVINDSLVQIGGYDSLAQSGIMWIAKPKKITVINEQTETANSLYISDPMPNPASNVVRFYVFYDKTLNFEQADITVYDILGNKVSVKEQFDYVYRNTHSSTIIWNTSEISLGVYFIYIRLGGAYFSKSVVIYN